MRKLVIYALILCALTAAPLLAQAEGEPAAEAPSHGGFATTFLWVAVVLLAAKVAGLVERWGQPAVLGELVMGVILGNLVLFGITLLEPIKHDNIISFLAELGVVILLFQIGLESNITQMRKVGVRAGAVAIIGVVVPFVLGTYIVGPWLLPELSTNAYLFIGAALTATSVGITARVFKDLGKLQMPEAQMVLGAAVIDDVLGLIILAVVSAMATLGAVSIGIIGWILAKAILFLVGAIVLGNLLAGPLCKAFSKINTGLGMKFTIALSTGLVFAFLAEKIGLAPIVGAFAAGLILDPVHFKEFDDPEICKDIQKAVKDGSDKMKGKVKNIIRHHADKHVEELLEPVALFLVPIFFIFTGMSVDLSALANIPILLTALGITVAAFFGKILSGLAAGKGSDKWLVGFGMVPRGEVGLIFAAIGRSLGVISNEVFSIIVIMVILTTLLTPPILTYLLKRKA
jgi:Kef-type K+ transport system membrane component KefB